jgi:glycerol uptake facilitator protein/aquaporin Z/aquaporin NIP
LRAFVVEVLVSFVLVSVATDDRVLTAIAPLAVGFALSAGVFNAGPVTGGSLNPASALQPMIVASQFTAAWV